MFSSYKDGDTFLFTSESEEDEEEWVDSMECAGTGSAVGSEALITSPGLGTEITGFSIFTFFLKKYKITKLNLSSIL